jgi:hypothetical protein
MSPRAFDSLMAALIRIGLLLALVIMLIAENAQAKRFLAPQLSVRGAIAVPGSAAPLLKTLNSLAPR